MRIVAISDTHNQHSLLTDELPDGDMIIHSGDFSGIGTDKEAVDFFNWFSERPYKHKILVPGNHDGAIQNNLKTYRTMASELGIRLLIDQHVMIDKHIIYGSPWTPEFFDWYFMKKRGPEISKVWRKIPHYIDILITHGPVFGILDKLDSGLNAGCEELKKQIDSGRLEELKLHICGHIHNSRGIVEKNNTIFINACSLDNRRQLQKQPYTVIDL